MTRIHEISVRPNQDFYRTTEPNRTRLIFTEPNRTEPDKHQKFSFCSKIRYFLLRFCLYKVILVDESTTQCEVSFKSNILQNSRFLWKFMKFFELQKCLLALNFWCVFYFYPLRFGMWFGSPNHWFCRTTEPDRTTGSAELPNRTESSVVHYQPPWYDKS